MSEMKIASPQEWAAWAEGKIRRLPYAGFPIRIVPVDAIDMMLESGEVYDMFTKLQAGEQVIDEDAFEELAKTYPSLKPFLAQLTLAAIGEPKVVRENADLSAGEIPLEWIKTVDRLFLFQEVFSEAQSLAVIFPAQQDGNIPAPSDGEDLRAAAQQLSGVVAAES